MIETHPFGNFVPQNTQYLFLGSFTGRLVVEGYDWFFANKRNQFWPILEEVYSIKLPTKKEKQELFIRLGMAITDIILSCERKANNNLDMNLTNIVYNTQAITDIFQKNKIETVFFSSRFTEKLFKRQFKGIISKHSEVELITLPSPSPRYARISKAEKVLKYKELLPKLVHSM